PPEQEVPPVQVAPQVPQLLWSVLVLTHVGGLPHIMKPVPVHDVVQCPPTHAPGHGGLQLPQCCGSALVSTRPTPVHWGWLGAQRPPVRMAPPPVPLVEPPLPDAPVITYAGSTHAAPQQAAIASQRTKDRRGRARMGAVTPQKVPARPAARGPIQGV